MIIPNRSSLRHNRNSGIRKHCLSVTLTPGPRPSLIAAYATLEKEHLLFCVVRIVSVDNGLSYTRMMSEVSVRKTLLTFTYLQALSSLKAVLTFRPPKRNSRRSLVCC